MRITLQLLILLLTTGSVFGREPVASGLLFSSKTESITQRTSLDLFDGRPRRFSRRFSLSFDISIRNARRFGYILRLIDPNGEEVSLVFVNFRSDNKYYIDFNTSRTGRNVQMRIPPDMSGTGKWVSVKLDFDLEADKAVICVDEARYECTGVGLSNPAKLRMVFGLHGINLDVPAMALKNIRIAEHGKTRWTIPLNESAGEKVHDTRGREAGTVRNPTWLITEHFNWHRAASFDAPLASGIAYNSSSNEVYVVGRDSLTLFQTDTRSLVPARIQPVPMRIDEALYNPKTNQTCLYRFDAPEAPDTLHPSIVLLDMETLAVERAEFPRTRNRLHHHNAFFDPECDTLFVFGGYGNFSYSNRLSRYDPASDSWQDVPLHNGESVYPRFFAATGAGRDDYEVLMFGGFGNKSGRQELGGRNLYDLTAIDLKTKSARKLWEIAPDSLYVPATNLVLSSDKKAFYALIYPHHIASSQLALCRFDLETGASEIVSDRIPILSEEIATKAFLFRNAPMNELVAVIREYKDPQRANIRIYTLSTPPVSADELVDYDRPGRMNRARTIGLAAIALGLTFIGLWLRRRRSGRAAQPANPVGQPAAGKVHIRRNAVYALGDFLAFDARGREITYRFSTKLRMLFALVLVHSKEQDDGLSTERLTATLWPDKEFSEAKNIRGVTINHLRKILNDLRGIELVCENSRWRFLFGEEFYCDYIRSMALCREIGGQGGGAVSPTDDESATDSLMQIASRGTLFPLVTEAWAEGFRHEYEKSVETAFLRRIARLQQTGASERIAAMAATLFAVDPLNEDTLSTAIPALKKAGRPDRALMLYNDFRTRFKAALGVDYPRPFESF